jgi:hypothetical protein
MTAFSDSQDRVRNLFNKRLILIVGATRWGTAWVQHCMDAHPDICAKGEGHFTDLLFPKIAKAFDDYNTECEKIGNRLQLAGLPGNAAGYTFDDVDSMLKMAIGLALDRWLDGRDPHCIAEKTQEHVLSLDLLSRVLPEAYIVHVVRDGRDEAVSAWEFNLGISRGDFPRQYPSFPSFVDTFSQAWGRSIGKARQYGPRNPLRYLEIRCEDITTNTSGVVSDILKFATVSTSAEVVRECADAAWDISPLDLEHGIWKSTFDDEAHRLFKRHGGELLKLLNYDT